MTTYLRNEETISGQLDDELVMVDIEKGNYYALSSVGTRIWELLEQPLTAEALCDRLEQEYDVTPQQCQTELSAYLETMCQLGLLKRVE